MSNPLMRTDSAVIYVRGHNGSDDTITISGTPIIPTTKLIGNNSNWLVDGDSGTWTCPICGQVCKYWSIGNSLVSINGKRCCVTGNDFGSDHYGEVISTDSYYDKKISITSNN